MGLRSALRASINGYSGVATPEKWLVDWVSGGIESAAGVRVDQETALYYGPFFAGVRVISEDLGGLPLPVYERLVRGKRKAPNHPLYPVLHDAANDMMSAVALRETLQGHALTWGTGHAYIVRNGAGDVAELWPLRPDRIRRFTPLTASTTSVRPKFVYLYRVDDVGPERVLFPDEVFRVHGLGPDGLSGYSLVALARQAIGLGLATEQYGAAFFGGGARPGGVLQHPEAVSTEARKRIKADWENLHRGLDRAHRIAILEEGVTWQAVGIPNDDAQFLETRKFGVTEMARWLRLPPHKIGDLERSTFSNIEEQQLDYIAGALRIWLVRWEQAIALQLLTAGERGRYFAEHILDALLRGDTAARYAAYAVGRQWGWLSADDIRERDNLNPLPDGRGEVYLVPLNMVPAPTPEEAAAAAAPKPPPELPGPAPDEDDVDEDQADEDNPRARAWAVLRGRGIEARRRAAQSWTPKIAETDERLAKLERTEVASLVGQHLGRGRSIGTFLTGLQTLYAADGLIAQESTTAWLPLLVTFASEVAADAAADVGYEDEVDLSIWAKAYALSHVAYRVAAAFGQLRKLVTGAGDDTDAAADAVLGRLDKWVTERPDRTAKWEGTQLPNAAARETWRVAGVKTLQWVASGDTCPYCRKLDGRVIGIEKPFLTKGDELTDGEAKLTVGRTIKHPPVHPGCDCAVVPG